MKSRKCKRQSVFFCKAERNIRSRAGRAAGVLYGKEYIVLAGVFLNGRQIKSSS